MKGGMLRVLLFVMCGLIFGAMRIPAADAAVVECGTPIDDYVVTNAGCLIGTSANDSEAKVNADALFGIDSWNFAGKDEDFDIAGIDEAGIDIGLVITSDDDGKTGTWAINQTAWDIHEAIMLVFKGGQGKDIIPENYVAYLLTVGEWSGTWTSPFSKNGNITATSHISAYATPLPPALLLFGSGLAGLAFLSRRRRRAQPHAA